MRASRAGSRTSSTALRSCSRSRSPRCSAGAAGGSRTPESPLGGIPPSPGCIRCEAAARIPVCGTHERGWNVEPKARHTARAPRRSRSDRNVRRRSAVGRARRSQVEPRGGQIEMREAAAALHSDRIRVAHQLYADALETAVDDETRAEALEGLGHVAHRSGRPREAVRLYEDSLRLLG